MEHKISIIGAGDIVRKAYLPILAGRNDCQIMAICSENAQNARELAHQYNIPLHSNDYRDILYRKDIDVVLICTPTGTHRLIAEAVMASQKHLLVEKPLCVTYSDSRDLLQKARLYDRVFYPAFNNHFREENQHFYQLVSTGEIGTVELMDFEWFRTKRYGNKTWLFNKELSGGGVIIDLGTHLIHLALSLIQKRDAFSATCINFTHDPELSPVEDTASAIICIDQKISIVLKLGWDMRMPIASKVNLQIFGEMGMTTNHDYSGLKTDGYNLMIQDFFNNMDEGSRPDLRLTDDTMLIVDSLYRSAAEKKTVTGHFTASERI